MTGLYILNEQREPVLTDDVVLWGKWMEKEKNRRVGETFMQNDKVHISTVFLGLDHGFMQGGEPVVFETMVFGGAYNQHQERCNTWGEAAAMHERVCEMVREEEEGAL